MYEESVFFNVFDHYPFRFPQIGEFIGIFEPNYSIESEKINTETNQENKFSPVQNRQSNIDSKIQTNHSSNENEEKKTKRNANIPSSNQKKEIANVEKKYGRIPKNSDKIGLHNKMSFDNIIRAIKTRISKYLNNLLNRSLKTTIYTFKKIVSVINKELKKEFNIELSQMKVKDIYEKFDISPRYFRQSKKNTSLDLSNYNREIIQYIEKNQKEEEEAYKILSLTYEDVIKRFIKDPNEGLEKFKSEIRNEENKLKNPEDLEKYISDIEYLFNNFKKWFEEKKGRKGGKRNKKEKK